MAWNRTERKHTHTHHVHITMVGGDAVVAGAGINRGGRGLNALKSPAAAEGSPPAVLPAAPSYLPFTCTGKRIYMRTDKPT